VRQLIQSLRTGETLVEEVPARKPPAGSILVRNVVSLVSAGTERSTVDFARKSLFQKARSRPDLVKQTLDKVRHEGVLTTLEAVRKRMDQPIPLGYSCAGNIIALGSDVSGFQVGDRVACAGTGHAVHAEIIWVPKNLAVNLPDNVDFEAASFTTLGTIALQGVRLAEVRLGEVVALIGLGLLGLLTLQILKAAGCTVVGVDPLPERAKLAERLGAVAGTTSPDRLTGICRQLTNGHGADAILITADTKSNQPVELAGETARAKGIVVAVGAVGMNIPRKVYFEKELDFRISRSYGPGRYDDQYEENGHDYPYAYVRWTEQRNMRAFVQLVAEDKVKVHPLITHRFHIADAPRAYELIAGKTGEPFLGVLLTYPDAPDLSTKVLLRAPDKPHCASPGRNPPLLPDQLKLGVIGAGDFANAVMLPAIRSLPTIKLIGLASGSGLSARSTANRFGFSYCTTDFEEILADAGINTVAILTRHNMHATQVIAALKAGKHVFVEKPLCLTEQQLGEIISAYSTVNSAQSSDDQHSLLASPLLMVGYNRRFSPFVKELKENLVHVGEPMVLNYRINAGYVSPDHWAQDPVQGGGRLIGEVCHFIDLLTYLVGGIPCRLTTRALPDLGRYRQDNLLITMEFPNGTLGTITYVANGDKGLGKECLEVFGGGLAARLDDYRSLLIRYGGKRVKRLNRLHQDKGHRGEWESLVSYLKGSGPLPMSFEEVIAPSQLTFAAGRSLSTGEPVGISLGED
jgi:predicted dehydrogenase/threonine dehydrogenase-like Zn-dependent dehydrogenase